MVRKLRRGLTIDIPVSEVFPGLPPRPAGTATITVDARPTKTERELAGGPIAPAVWDFCNTCHASFEDTPEGIEEHKKWCSVYLWRVLRILADATKFIEGKGFQAKADSVRERLNSLEVE